MAMHGNAWHCSIAEDQVAKDLCFHVVRGLYSGPLLVKLDVQENENDRLFTTD
jgi:hypothetical protein